MEKILIDSDVLIDYLRGYNKRILSLFEKLQNRQIAGIVSTINIVKLYSGRDTRNKKKLLVLKKILSFFQIIPLKTEIAESAGSIRLKYSVGLADSIIAATCIKERAKLCTFNIRDFQKIKELDIFDMDF